MHINCDHKLLCCKGARFAADCDSGLANACHMYTFRLVGRIGSCYCSDCIGLFNLTGLWNLCNMPPLSDATYDDSYQV
jgi:hypothetical protein